MTRASRLFPTLALLAACGGSSTRTVRYVDDSRRSPPSSYEHYAIAEIMAAHHDHAGAVRELSRALGIDDDGYLRLRFAEETAANGSLRPALEILTGLVAASPRDPLPRIARARLYVGAARYREARADLDWLAHADAAGVEQDLLGLADLMARSNLDSDALSLLQPLMRRSPHDPLVVAAYAEALAMTGHAAAATEALTTELARHPAPTARADAPETAALHTALAYIHQRQGDTDQAIAELGRAIAADETFAPALTALGHLYMGLGRHPEAEETLARADTVAPGTAEVHYYLAELERGRGQSPRAEELLRQALAEDPPPDVRRSIEDRLRELGALRANN